MSEDVAKFINDQQLAPASCLGHSMGAFNFLLLHIPSLTLLQSSGGRAMMYFALKYPHLVERLIVVDISPVSPIGTNRTDIPLFLKAMQSIEIPNEFTIHQGRQVANERLTEIISEQSLRDFLITNLVKTESGFRWRVNLETLQRDFQAGVSHFPDCTGLVFEGPTLFIGGSKSDYLLPSDKPKIDQLFPNSELVYLDAGHWVHAEKPEEFLNLVLNFLNH